MAKLVLHRPDGEMRDILLDRDRVTIGRRRDHDICLPFPAVSADHAEIITVMDDSFLHDLGSTNGTLVNGERVTNHFLRNGDTIDVGREQLVYLTDDAETIEPLPADRWTGYVRSDPATMPDEVAEDDQARDEVDVEAALAPVDELMTDLMEMQTESSAAVDIPPSVSIVRSPSPSERNGAAHPASANDAAVEILSGPHAGQIAPMRKPEFVLGKLGATVAAIRRDGGGYRLVPMDRTVVPLVNGLPISPDGASLAFGDTIDVGGVKLRFDRQA